MKILMFLQQIFGCNLPAIDVKLQLNSKKIFLFFTFFILENVGNRRNFGLVKKIFNQMKYIISVLFGYL